MAPFMPIFSVLILHPCLWHWFFFLLFHYLHACSCLWVFLSLNKGLPKLSCYRCHSILHRHCHRELNFNSLDLTPSTLSQKWSMQATSSLEKTILIVNRLLKIRDRVNWNIFGALQMVHFGDWSAFLGLTICVGLFWQFHAKIFYFSQFDNSAGWKEFFRFWHFNEDTSNFGSIFSIHV